MKNLTYTAGSYPAEQQIHSLSSIANTAFGLSLASLSDLQAYVTKVTTDTLANSVIQGYIGNDWTPVWGTIVASQNPDASLVVVDNAMGLFFSPGQNLFVLAIAGTNINSTYDWLHEDFDVNNTVLWQNVVQAAGITVPTLYANAAISGGTNNGLQALLGMTDTATNQSMLTAFTAYLSSNNISGATLAVAGHSLAGALTPTMALYLYNLQQSSTENWNVNGAVTVIQAWPTAGPTPGEAVFASYYESLVSANPNSFTYTSKYNTLDVVPQAWQLADMQTVPTLYDSNLSTSPSPVVGPLVLGAMYNTLLKTGTLTYQPIQYTQISPRTTLPGTFSILINFGASVLVNSFAAGLNLQNNNPLKTYSTMVVSVAEFLAQMAFQHTTAYTGGIIEGFQIQSLLGIYSFTIQFETIKKQDSPTDQSTAELHNQALAYVLNKYIVGITPQQLALAQAQQMTNAT